MRLLLASSALAIAFAVPAHAQQVTTQSTTEGQVTVQGVEPSKVLGAIDTQKLTDKGVAETTVVAQAQPPDARAQVTVDTRVEQTSEATVETRTEVITPVSGRPALDPETPIAPEVQAVVNSGRKYTTRDIVLAQLEAIRKTPVTQPTTVITTTTTTPEPG